MNLSQLRSAGSVLAGPGYCSSQQRVPNLALRRSLSWLVMLVAAGSLYQLEANAASPPVISNVTAAQRSTNKLVDISYTISDPNFSSVNVFVLVAGSSKSAAWDVPAQTFLPGSAVGTNIPVTITPTTKTITWDAGADWNGNYTTSCRVRVLANNVGLVLIPPGTYNRGDNLDGEQDAPVYPVYVSAFYMDANLVSGAFWVLVKGYADANGYTFVNPGSFKALNHPIQTVDWYDSAKWCNARSEREGLTPVYYSDAGFTTVYKTGESAPYWKPGANGYRLPTEAEWEKAARGG